MIASIGMEALIAGEMETAVCGNQPTAAPRAVIEGVNSIVTTVMDAIRQGVTPREVSIIGETAARRREPRSVAFGIRRTEFSDLAGFQRRSDGDIVNGVHPVALGIARDGNQLGSIRAVETIMSAIAP
jgi:hypothetical protein